MAFDVWQKKLNSDTRRKKSCQQTHIIHQIKRSVKLTMFQKHCFNGNHQGFVQYKKEIEKKPL